MFVTWPSTTGCPRCCTDCQSTLKIPSQPAMRGCTSAPALGPATLSMMISDPTIVSVRIIAQRPPCTMMPDRGGECRTPNLAGTPPRTLPACVFEQPYTVPSSSQRPRRSRGNGWSWRRPGRGASHEAGPSRHTCDPARIADRLLGAAVERPHANDLRCGSLTHGLPGTWVRGPQRPGRGAVVAGTPIATPKSMARALWKGAISFGLVTIPVDLFSAIEAREELSFNLLHAKDG